MGRKRFAPEDMIGHLIEIESGKGYRFQTPLGSRVICEQPYDRRKREYGVLRAKAGFNGGGENWHASRSLSEGWRSRREFEVAQALAHPALQLGGNALFPALG